MNKQSSKSSRSATSASALAGRAHFARWVSHLIPSFGLAPLAGALLALLLSPARPAHVDSGGQATMGSGATAVAISGWHGCAIRRRALLC